MGGKGALNYLPIVPKASIYVPKVMCKPVMGGNAVSETFTHMLPFQSASNLEVRVRVLCGYDSLDASTASQVCCEMGQSVGDYTYTYDGWPSSEYS